MLRVIVDTNILISGLFFDKNPERLLLLAIDGKIKMILLDLVISEVEEKIEGKLSTLDNLGQAKNFWYVLKRAFQETDSDILCDKTEEIECRDDDDKEILIHASQMKPDYFISGDEDVLDASNSSFKIMGLRDFLEKEFPIQPI